MMPLNVYQPSELRSTLPNYIPLDITSIVSQYHFDQEWVDAQLESAKNGEECLALLDRLTNPNVAARTFDFEKIKFKPTGEFINQVFQKIHNLREQGVLSDLK